MTSKWATVTIVCCNIFYCDINDGIINGKNRLLSYIILYYLQFCSVKMSVDSLNELLEKLDSVNYPPIPPCALVLIEL